MTNSQWKIVITSGPLSEEYLEAEITYDDEPWATVTEFGKKVIFFPRSTDDLWRLDFDEVIDVLKFARDELLKGITSV